MAVIAEAPTSRGAEWAVLSRMLREPGSIPEVIGVPLEQRDFSSPDTRVIFARAIERHFSGRPIDPLIVAELVRGDLAQFWNAEAAHVASLLERRVNENAHGENVLEHAQIVKELSTKRKLMDIGHKMLAEIDEGKLSPEEIGDRFATESLQATAGTIRRSEMLSWIDKGATAVKQLRLIIDAKRNGVELGVYTGLPFIDNHTYGIGPGELCFLASEPGAGKTGLAWAAAMGFAARQMRRGQNRVSTLVLSMEMGQYASFLRLVTSLTGIDGTRLREGDITDAQYTHVLQEWKIREDLPIYWNFASNFRCSQMRALIAEGIRRHNVGFVIIDHFRMLDPDRRNLTSVDADEAKVRFIKENVCKDMDVAVMCLAHTSKIRERTSAAEFIRPRLSDLRGSGMISAFADQVGLLWCPHKYMTDDERIEKMVAASDMEIDWAKNRFGASSVGKYTFMADSMKVLPRV
jgi:replicative DNA helicase